MVGIYKITNKLNKKVYIGQSVNIEVRFKDHKSKQKRDREPDSHLYRAIEKYGLENFTFEVLEECSVLELNGKESYYIKLLKSNDKKFGYNRTEGGDSHSIGENNGRALLQEEDVINIRKLRSQFKTRNEVYELYKDKITLNGFLDIWQNRRWSHIVVEGAYSKEVKEFQNSLKGGRNSALLTDEEVTEIRNRYVKETVKEIYEDYKNIYASIGSFEIVVHGRSYSRLPIYKKREKICINK